MYILILDDIEVGYAINSACHAAVACTLKYQDTSEVQEWLNTKFRKVTCKVTREEFEKAIEVESDHVIMTELNLNDREMCVAFKPREEYHKMFKFLRLYK
jgi:peptidyl-tRNA hydrolase